MATTTRARRRKPPTDNLSNGLKVKLRGKDDQPLTMTELRQLFYQLSLKLAEYEPDYRAKFATLYLTLVDENGVPVRINDSNELTMFPYKSAAEELGA